MLQQQDLGTSYFYSDKNKYQINAEFNVFLNDFIGNQKPRFIPNVRGFASREKLYLELIISAKTEFVFKFRL